ncbi:hypothetical protein P0Y35_13080 [Kiritimatiellaeota bacterium B1221]|nr:hypothetical protein [Kiritimatiellaeota bacterium B1221]
MPQALRQFETLLTRHFSLFLISALAVGLLFPPLADASTPLISPLLMGVIYLSFLKTDYTVLAREIRNGKRQLWLNVFSLVLLPSLLFLLVKAFEHYAGTHPAWGTGVLLLYACPVAAMAPTLALVMHGHFERTLCILILNSIIAPFTLPLLLSFWVGTTLDAEPWRMVLFLARLILIPFAFAQLTIHRGKPILKALKPHTAALSVFLLCLVVIGGVAGLSETVKDNPRIILEGVAVSSVCLFLAYVIGWFLHLPGASLRDRSTLSVIAAWSNIGLSIVFAKQFFPDSDILLFVVLSEIPWNMAFAPAHAFIRKRSRQHV